MGKRPVVEVDGLKELRRTLRKAGDDMADLKTANSRVAEIVADGATIRVPTRSGALAGTIRSSGTKTLAIVRAGRAAVPYAGPVHWGWPDRNIETNPFLVDAAQATEPKWIPIYESHLDQILSNIKGT